MLLIIVYCGFVYIGKLIMQGPSAHVRRWGESFIEMEGMGLLNERRWEEFRETAIKHTKERYSRYLDTVVLKSEPQVCVGGGVYGGNEV